MRLYVIILKYLELDKNMENSYKIWFISDLHFHHFNILKFQDERREIMGLTEEVEEIMKIEKIDKHDERLPNLRNSAVAKHNEWVINMWNNTVDKHDHIYILGDISFGTTEETKKILERLHGKKHLVVGNHDKPCNGLENYFESVSQIKEFPIKKHQYDFLEENIYLVLCHYPLGAWNRRLHGSWMIHGHIHGGFDDINIKSEDLRVDIGLDSDIANFGLVSLEQLYKFMKNKIAEKGFTDFEKYIEWKSDKDGIRY